MLKMLIIALSVCWMAAVCSGQDPVLTPSTLSDSVNNQADENSDIVWSDIDPGTAYKVDGVYDAGGLGAFFDMTRYFINAVFPVGIPIDFIKGLLEKAPSIIEIVLKSFQAVGGYCVCIVFGLLFLVIFPIVGCCFCCCRMCGCCGGKKTQVTSESTSCKRKVFCVIFLVLIVFTGVGCICVFVSNDRMTGAVEQFEPTFSDNIDDVFTFVNNTYMQIERVLDNDLTFVIDVLKRDINNSNVLVGIPLRDNLLQVLNLNSIFKRLSYISKVVNQFDTVKANSNNLNTKRSDYETKIKNWNLNYDSNRTACSGCNLPDGTELCPNSNETDLTTVESEITNIRNANVDAKLNDAQTKLNDIPNKIKTEVDDQNLVQNIDKFKSEIDPLLTNIEEQIKEIQKSINVDQYKQLVKEFTDMAKPYDKYRWYGGLGISCVILLVVVLQILGLVFGFCGSSASTLPTKRGCLSTCGGNLLMASVGFIFIFSSLLMLLTTLTFTFGSPVERFLCQPLSDPALTDITRMMEAFGIQDPIRNFTGGAKIGELTKDCADGKTVYTVLRLENQPSFNLSKILNYKEQLDLKTKIDKITIDFTPVIDALKDVETQVKSIESEVQSIDVAPMKVVLAQRPTPTDMTVFINDLQAEVNKGSNPNFQALLSELQTISGVQYLMYIEARKNLTASVDVFESDVNALKAEITKLPDELKEAQNNLTNNGAQLVKKVLDNMIDRIYKIVDSLVKRAVDGLKEDIAPCLPIYNIYKSLVVNGFCKHVLDSFNGFWFGIGWSLFFFVPSLIFAVKLAKYFRKMKRLGGIDVQKANSVGHSDNV